MHSDEHVHTASGNGVSGAVEGLCVSFTACCWVSAVVAVVCVLDEALLVVFEVVAAGFIVVVSDDVAAAVGAWGVVMGSLCITGAGGVDWGQQGGVGGLLGRRCSCLGGFIKYTTRSSEHVCTTSRNGISRAVDGLCVSFMASFTVSGESVFVWVLDAALGAVFGVVIARFVVDVGGNMVTAGGGSGCG
jgi:hypothetical protein